MSNILTNAVNGISQYIPTLIVLFGMMVADIATGITCAFIRKELDSTKMRNGCAKKISELAIIIAAMCIDNILKMAGTLGTAVEIYYIANEGLSVIENAALSGIPIPKFLRESLKKAQDDGDSLLTETLTGGKNE